MTPAGVLWKRETAASRPVRIAGAVMVVNALLLTAHVLHRSGFVLDPDGGSFFLFRSSALWNGGIDGSLMELFGLLQLGAAAVLLLRLGLRDSAHRVLAAWGCIFLLLIADDLFRIHERVGARLALDRLLPSLGATTAQELGGLAFWALSGLVLVGVMVRLHRASVPMARPESWALLATVVPFVLVAVGYVLLGAVRPGLFDGPWGEVAALVRITVKLLTMTLLLVRAVRLLAERP
ncbi:hypothetical protein [Kocuria rosea]|uniref:Uncharacterized protein n=1 Tax=Kocuria rosea TaxID=1275 RepID=A0A4R5Y2J0_KOCRO|nr:hypothetical protein [Kocuria rosea]TDL37455.1 hypothetical protein E2R59_17810 [Kocuria rosea]